MDNLDQSKFKNILQTQLPVLRAELNSFSQSSVGPIFAMTLDERVRGGENSQIQYYFREISITEAKVWINSFLKLEQNIVLFDDSVRHIFSIYHSLRNCRGSIILISSESLGRRTLSRIAVKMCEYVLFELDIHQHYTKECWIEDIKKILIHASKSHVVLLAVENQLSENMLADISAILISRELGNLFAMDELTVLLEDLRGSIDSNGSETFDQLFTLFLERIQCNFHFILCVEMEKFVNYVSLKFPALTSLMFIDYFSTWLEPSLKVIYNQFIGWNKDLVSTDLSDLVVKIHSSAVSIASNTDAVNISPVCYVDFVNGFTSVLSRCKSLLEFRSNKLKNGLSKLNQAQGQVSLMSVTLEQKKKVVHQKKNESEKMLIEIVQQQRFAEEQKKLVFLLQKSFLIC